MTSAEKMFWRFVIGAIAFGLLVRVLDSLAKAQ